MTASSQSVRFTLGRFAAFLSRILLAFVFSYAWANLAGCASAPNDGAGESTSGVDFTMFFRDETGSEMYFTLNKTNTLGYGGGLSARLNKTTWSGALSEDEARRFHELLAAADWFRSKPASTYQPPERRYRVKINAPQSHRTFTVKGEHSALQPLRELLAQSALRRWDAELQKLPQPSSQRQE